MLDSILREFTHQIEIKETQIGVKKFGNGENKIFHSI
jgi:hypothetical protein